MEYLEPVVIICSGRAVDVASSEISHKHTEISICAAYPINALPTLCFGILCSLILCAWLDPYTFPTSLLPYYIQPLY